MSYFLDRPSPGGAWYTLASIHLTGIYMETPKVASNGQVFGEYCRGDKQQVGVVVKVTTG